MTEPQESLWDRLIKESDTDALVETWGIPPLWSAPLHDHLEEENQK